jgi:hypothetical protein
MSKKRVQILHFNVYPKSPIREVEKDFFMVLKLHLKFTSFIGIFVIGWLFISQLSSFAQPAQLMVAGNQLVTVNNGCTVVLKGIDYSGLEISPSGNGYGVGMTVISGVAMANMVGGVAEAVTAWHANLIRLPLNQDFWMGCGNSKSNNNPVTVAAYQGMVQSIINYCSQNNAYVMLDLHWSGTSSTASSPCGAGWGTATGQQSMPDANSVTFWGSVANTSWVKNNPAVLLDLYNEPYDPTYADNAYTWTIWKGGGNMGTANGATSFTTPGLEALVTTIRNAGANNVIVAGGLNWAYDLKGIVGKEGGAAISLTDPGVVNAGVTTPGNGIVYAAHIYPSKGASGNFNPSTDAVTYIDPCAAVDPVIISEFGESTSCLNNVNDNGAWDNTLTQWISTQPGIVGGAGWALNTNQCPALITSWVTFATTSNNGTPVTQWLATQVPTCPTGPTNTPTISYTPTPSLTPTNTRTDTNSPTPSNTQTLSPTVSLTFTQTPVFSPTITNTPTLSDTPTETNSPTVTFTLTATLSPTDTFTQGPTDTITLTPVNTYTSTDTFAPTASDTLTLSPTPSLSSTSVPSDTPTISFTPTSSFTITESPVLSFTFTDTPTPLVPTSTFTPTWTLTNTPVNTATITLTPGNTSTFTLTSTVLPPGISAPYPNPSNGDPVQFTVNIDNPQQIQWDVYTLVFRKIRSGRPSLGTAQFQWDLKDSVNNLVSNGAYYVRIQVGTYITVRKVLVLR